MRVLAKDRDPRTTWNGDTCGAGLSVPGPDDDVAEAARLVRERAVRRIPVPQDGTPAGLVSIGDLARGKYATSALSGISAAPPSS